MMKKYVSRTQVGLSVSGAGIRRRVSFDALTGGGGVFYTADENLQRALSAHPMYGRLFREEAMAEETVEEPAVAEDDAVSDSVIGMSFASLDDAKEYLVERFGLSRTKLRSAKAILSEGASRGVEITIGG